MTVPFTTRYEDLKGSEQRAARRVFEVALFDDPYLGTWRLAGYLAGGGQETAGL